MIDKLKFASKNDKISFGGLLLLSEKYFDINNPVRKKIQCVIIGRVDCIVQMREEQFNVGIEIGLLEAAKILLRNGFSVFEVQQDIDLPFEKIEELKKEIESS